MSWARIQQKLIVEYIYQLKERNKFDINLNIWEIIWFEKQVIQ